MPNTWVLKIPSTPLLGIDMFTLTLVDLEYEASCFYLGIWNVDRIKWLFCLHFISLHDLIHKTQMKLSLLLNYDTLICLWIFIYSIGIFEVTTSRNCFFYIISVPYTITDLQAPETLYLIPRGAKWNDVKNVLFSSSKWEKKSGET